MTSNDSESPRVQSQYRLPRDVHEWLKAEAAKQNRSLNAQLVHILQTAKEADGN